jgi:hypothetical protein
LAYQPPASSTFLSEQTSHQQPARVLLSQNKPAPAISHQANEQAVWLGGARGVAAGLLEAGLVVGGVGLTPQGHLQSSGRQDELLEMRETGKQLCASVPCQSLIVRTDEIQQKKKESIGETVKKKTHTHT